jgi:hypothetical protein
MADARTFFIEATMALQKREPLVSPKLMSEKNIGITNKIIVTQINQNRNERNYIYCKNIDMHKHTHYLYGISNILLNIPHLLQYD